MHGASAAAAVPRRPRRRRRRRWASAGRAVHRTAGALLFLAAPTPAAGSVSLAEGLAAEFKPSTRWRVTNLDTIAYGWRLGEVRFFTDAACAPSSELTGAAAQAAAVAAGKEPPTLEASGHHGDSSPSKAIDGQTWTEWRAQCFSCDPLQAWIGFSAAEPVNIRCVQFWQWGENEYKTAEVALDRWEASTGAWQRVLHGSGLDSGKWETLNFVFCGVLEAPNNGRVEVTNGGYHPSKATFSCTGARILSGFAEIECAPEGSWKTFGESGRRCWSLMEIILFSATFFAIECTLFSAYYCFKIRKKDQTSPPLTQDSFIPEENQNAWSNDFILDAQDKATSQLMWCIFCPFCRVADTWRLAGFAPFAGTAVLSQLCCLVTPCAGAYMRGRIRARTRIKSKPYVDFLQWLCCMPCAAAQEARHLEDLCEVSHRESLRVLRNQEKKEEIEAKAQEMMALPSRIESTRYGRPTERSGIYSYKNPSVLECGTKF